MTSRDRTMETCYILLVPAGLWAPEHVVSRRDFIRTQRTDDARASSSTSRLGSRNIFYICSLFRLIVLSGPQAAVQNSLFVSLSVFHKICSKMCAYKAMSAAQKPEQRCSTTHAPALFHMLKNPHGVRDTRRGAQGAAPTERPTRPQRISLGAESMTRLRRN